MLHPAEIANLQQTLDRTHAAIGTLAAIEQELRLIKKGMAPTPEKTRVEQMLRLTRETIAGLQRKLPMLDQAGAAPPDGRSPRTVVPGPDGHDDETGRGKRKTPRK